MMGVRLRRVRVAGKALFSRAVTICVACVAGWMALPSGAAAQGAPWQFEVTPYLWVVGVNGTTSTPASGINFNRGFSDILKDLSGLPIMIGGEVRKGNVGVMFDMVWFEIKSDIDTRNVLFNDGKAQLEAFQFTAVGFYRPIEEAAGTLDIGAGARFWSISTKASLNPGLLPGVSAKENKTFVDPVLATRITFRLGGRWSLTGYGDIGGFGIGSDLTWQALGTLNYRAADWVDLRLGWRHMAVDRKKIDVDFDGPIVAATFRF